MEPYAVVTHPGKSKKILLARRRAGRRDYVLVAEFTDEMFAERVAELLNSDAEARQAPKPATTRPKQYFGRLKSIE